MLDCIEQFQAFIVWLIIYDFPIIQMRSDKELIELFWVDYYSLFNNTNNFVSFGNFYFNMKNKSVFS